MASIGYSSRLRHGDITYDPISDIGSIQRQLTTQLLNDINLSEEAFSKAAAKAGSVENVIDWIQNLPVYIIEAHAAIDINMNLSIKTGGKKPRVNGTGLKLKEKLHSEYSLTTFKNRDDEFLRFIVSPAPPNTYGLGGTELYEDHEKHDVFHRNKHDLIKCLFNNSVGEHRIDNIPHKTSPDGDIVEDEDLEHVTGGYYLPGMNVVQKNHSFHGNPLLGGGFGIIKLTNNDWSCNSRKPKIQERIEAVVNNFKNINKDEWKKNHWDKDRVTSGKNKFYIIDQGWDTSTKEKRDNLKHDLELRNLLNNHDDLFLDQITDTLGDCIVITLSCSIMHVGVVDELAGRAEYISFERLVYRDSIADNWLKFLKGVLETYEEMFTQNKFIWDSFTEMVGWKVKHKKNCTQAALISDIYQLTGEVDSDDSHDSYDSMEADVKKIPAHDVKHLPSTVTTRNASAKLMNTSLKFDSMNTLPYAYIDEAGKLRRRTKRQGRACRTNRKHKRNKRSRTNKKFKKRAPNRHQNNRSKRKHKSNKKD